MKIYPLSYLYYFSDLIDGSSSHSWGNESIKGAYKATALVGKSVKNLEGKDLGQI